MREHFVGRSSRLTAYFCGISLGLALLVAGLEAVRTTTIELSGPGLVGYLLIGGLGGIGLSFVAGYLNGSAIASWAAGSVPAAGRLGEPLAMGTLAAVPRVLFSALATGILLGTVGFLLAVEKHRRDARSTTLPNPVSRRDLVRITGVSLLIAAGLFVIAGVV